MSTAVVFGGYGTFGTHVARELSRLGIAVVIVGRNRARAEALATQLGRPHRGVRADVRSVESCRQVLAGQHVAVNCAGPFDQLGTALLEACLLAQCHYVDIADDRHYTATVRAYGHRFAAQGLAAVHGCSSLPGLSGALALMLADQATEKPVAARVTLFIGNANPKGQAAVQSLLAILGKRFPAPQGWLRGFRDREVVPLPRPFGRRAVFNFVSPEYDLFPELLGVRTVRVKVGFELAAVTYAIAALAAVGLPEARRLGPVLGRVGSVFGGVGHSGGVVMTELFDASGRVRRAALYTRQGGQVMAALPAALAVEALVNPPCSRFGAMAVYDLLGAQGLVGRMQGEGFELEYAEKVVVPGEASRT